MGYNTLSSMLWRERQLLELLLFKLEEEQLLLTSGRTRWLPHATREVENVLEQIRDTELGRSVETDALATELGLEPGATLKQIAGSAPSPWDELLTSHHTAFVTLTTQIDSLAAGNRELLTTAQRAVQETLMALNETVQTYDSSGATRASATSASLLDETL